MCGPNVGRHSAPCMLLSTHLSWYVNHLWFEELWNVECNGWYYDWQEILCETCSDSVSIVHSQIIVERIMYGDVPTWTWEDETYNRGLYTIIHDTFYTIFNERNINPRCYDILFLRRRSFKWQNKEVTKTMPTLPFDCSATIINLQQPLCVILHFCRDKNCSRYSV